MRVKNDWLFIGIVFVILILSNPPVVAGTFQNEPEGFRGIKWGTDIKVINGMKHTSSTDDGHMKIYKKEQDDMEIGQAELTTLNYYFWDDSYYTAYIEVKDYLNFMRLRDAVFEKFGKVEETKQVPTMESYRWRGDKTNILLFYNKTMPSNALMISSVQIRSKIDQYRKSKAKKGAEKGF